MLNVDKISNGLLGLVGFRQPYNPKYAILDTDNTSSLSGIYVNDNAYAKVEYLKDNQDYVNISDEDFNTLLKDMQKASIVSVCNQVFSEFDFIDRNLLYKTASNRTETETLPAGFVGYKIEVSSSKDLAFKINRVILDFNGTGSFTLMLWNTGKKQPLYTKEITITTDNQAIDLGWTLDNSGTTYKGDYYIGYVATGVTAIPFKRENAIINTIKCISVSKVCVKGFTGTSLFNLDNVDGLSEDIGLNLDISVYDDYTDFILNNKMLFAKAISLEFIIRCLQSYVSSIRSNANQKSAAELYQKIMIEIEGTKGSDSLISVVGLREMVLGEISRLKIEVNKLSVGKNKSRQFLLQTQK